jgi:predicted HicB family RNase H-like nuclease
MTEEIDTFAAMFPAPPGNPVQLQAREVRQRREKRAQMTERQRKRQAVRTAQLNFRCSPAFKARAAAMAGQLECSLADLFELALDALAHAKGLEDPRND